MQMRICKSVKINILLILIFCFAGNVLTAEDKWVNAFEKFHIKKAEDSLAKTLSEQIPLQIAENFSSSQMRTILPRESADRKKRTLKDERISLYLQLDSAIKKRDSLVLQNLSEQKLSSKILEEEKNIQSIKNKLEENIKLQNEADLEAEKQIQSVSNKKELTELEKYAALFKGLFTSENQDLAVEKVTLYGNGSGSDSIFYKTETELLPADYKSHAFEKKMYQAKINGLVTGSISIIGDYVAVTCELYVYPGARSVCAVTEIGRVSDTGFIAQTIASSLVPEISSSLPVNLKINVEPAEVLAEQTFSFSVDDIVYKSADVKKKMTVDSGVHSLRFECHGYRTAVTSFFFEGNEVYEINVSLKKAEENIVHVVVPDLLKGQIYANGEFKGQVDGEGEPASITINDNEILGFFISEDSAPGFYFIPEKLVIGTGAVSLNPNVLNKSDYIDTRRKWMYTAYSTFLISFLVSVVTYSNFDSAYNAFMDGGKTSYDLAKEAQTWNRVFLTSAGVTVLTGGFWGYELVRYLKAADSVLPVTGKTYKPKKNKNKKETELKEE